jgi:AmmeMemoRadiSam system protein B/AmmeMemoRadiSam system protein A
MRPPVAVALGVGMLLGWAAGCRRPNEPASGASQAAAAAVESASRGPAVAGMFYPADPEGLRALVGKLLAQARPPQMRGEVVGLVVPHAGYSYSAAVAAYAYKTVQGRRGLEVVVIGPSHHLPLSGAGLSSAATWRTPLGEVEVDQELNQALQATAPQIFHPADEAHAPEHSIEVQLPFLQVALQDFKLVPVLIQDFSPENCKRIGQVLGEVLRGRHCLLVASTDLAHYPPTELCRQVDLKTLANIEKRALGAIYQWEQEATARYADRNVACTMCGLGPVVAVLVAAEALGADQVVRLKYANSGEIEPATAQRSVGYGALALVATHPTQPKPSPTQDQSAAGGGKQMAAAAPPGSADNLTREQQKQLLALAREAISEWVKHRRRIKPAGTDPAWRERRAVFVTLRKRGQLRGCIGTLEPVAPLGEAVVEAAISAATQDPRFSPTQPEELPELDIHISVLSPLRRVDKPEEIVLGKHGIVVQQGGRRGVFLPEVAIEQGWDLETTLTVLCVEKAGLPGDAWKHGAELYVFTTQSFGEQELGLGPHAGP